MRSFESRLVGAFVATVAAVVFGLHVAGLECRSLWFDEAFSWQNVSFELPEMIERLKADVHPPLYYLVLKGVTSVFGDGVGVLRGLSLFFCATFLIAVAWLALEASRDSRLSQSRAERRTTAGIAVLTLLLNAQVFRLAEEVRMYTLGLTVAAVSSALFVRMIRNRRSTGWEIAAFALCETALLFTHYYGAFSIAARVAFLGVLYVRRPLDDRMRGHGPKFLLAWIGVGLAFAPWVPTFAAQRRQVADDYWIAGLGLGTAPWIAEDLFFHHEPTEINDARGWATALTLAAAAAWAASRGGAEAYVSAAMVLPILGAVAASVAMGRSIVMPRYLSFAILPHAAVLIALASAHVPRLPRYALLGAMLLLTGNRMYEQSLTLSAPHTGVRGAAAVLAEQFRPGDVVLCGNSRFYFGLRYYSRSAIPILQIAYPGHVTHYGGKTVFRDGELIDPIELAGFKGRVWVLESTSFLGKKFAVPPGWFERQWYTFRDQLSFVGECTLRRYDAARVGEVHQRRTEGVR